MSKGGGGSLVLNIIYYILLTINNYYLSCSGWEFTSVRVSPCCVLPSCAFFLYIMFYFSICMFNIDCTAEIKYTCLLSHDWIKSCSTKEISF